ncbi:MAG: chromosome segregation protein SMC [Sphingomonadaceae bacterium]|nr:chromosome segregation protein SMC [Sphingomonadaceae bacterium]
MRIKKLKLVGFKSFVEPAELKIETGLTGIVGPNGCGKSNLLEAIRWVMGESSPKSMRGTGMEDVIFAGTASRPARDFAEVTISAEREIAEAANDEDSELEVTRRIERGAGSAYRSNGRDVRAKDVALIFADAATGAHSPALVSQGRIGAIISAKPNERRQMLEEAAGISGLHVRRKDAEQKLRAAETNLARLATILADMDGRAGSLRRQAKQAERYRKLSKDILQGEARLIYVRWQEAKAAADAARTEANAASEAVDKATVVQRELTDRQQTAVRELAEARSVAMAARDAASELSNKLIQLTSERDRIIQRQTDLAAQAARMADDGAREDRLTHDAADALQRLQTESVALAEQLKAFEDERPAITRRAENAERQVRESEVALAKAAAEQARADAELRVADAALSNAQARVERAVRDMARLDQERTSLGDEDELQDAKTSALRAVADLQDRIAAGTGSIQAADARRAALIDAREKAQSEFASAKAELAALQSEQGALERALASGGGDQAIDRIKVVPGYERALAAALGDDANAAIGGSQGRRWAGSAAAIPAIEGTRLIDHVDAPAELHARLSLIRVVDSDRGEALAPGQRLVTRDGKLRRWDGFAADDDGATTAERLIRANRLSELAKLIPPAEAALLEQAEAIEQIAVQISSAQEEHRAEAAAQQGRENDLRQALRAADQAEDALGRLLSARAALEERTASARLELDAAKGDLELAQAARDSLPDGSHHAQLVQKLTIEGEAIRQMLARSQADLSSLDQRIAQTRERRAVAMAEIRSWQDRAGEAERRISDMKKRSAEIATEQEAMAGRPDILATEISALQNDKDELAEKLAQLQVAETGSEAALKSLEAEMATAAEALSSAREARAGAEARAENQDQRRVEMGRISGERFECPPSVLPEKLEFDEGALDDAAAESARLDRLQNERERIGPVNLIAADELAELEEQQSAGMAESEELTQAINRLRGSIGSLNREGRARLLTAFEAVDGHFRRLFSTLFNGGQAHLALIDSDDPLEAGLEIFAQPPGKKLQSLTLLSGGEQALTAVALIFGLFLTNPAPICVLDEVDAPLDDANIERFCDLLDAMTRETDTRYLIVTHNAVTMSRMHRLFGVTMVEQGVSRLVSVDLGGAEELLAAE